MIRMRTIANVGALAAAFILGSLLIPRATPSAYAQLNACSSSSHPYCYNVQLASCPTANRVCGVEDSVAAPGDFTCACRNTCSNSQSCASDEACIRGHCSSSLSCNSDGDCSDASGVRDTVCSNGFCAKGPPFDPLACTSDTSCQTGNPCSGAQSCDRATSRCVTGTPIACVQPGPVVVQNGDGSYTLLGRHAHCEPVAGSNTASTCVTTTEPPAGPKLCAPDQIDNPTLTWDPPDPSRAAGGRGFRYVATLHGTAYKPGVSPEVFYLRLTYPDGKDAVLASTAMDGAPPGAGWHEDRKTGTWTWKRPDEKNPITSVTLKPVASKRVAVSIDVRGTANVAEAPVRAPAPRKVAYVIGAGPAYALEAGFGWSSGLHQRACTVVVGGCRRAANGGLLCTLPGSQRPRG
jgi:hypothetical protein